MLHENTFSARHLTTTAGISPQQPRTLRIVTCDKPSEKAAAHREACAAPCSTRIPRKAQDRMFLWLIGMIVAGYAVVIAGEEIVMALGLA